MCLLASRALVVCSLSRQIPSHQRRRIDSSTPTRTNLGQSLLHRAGFAMRRLNRGVTRMLRPIGSHDNFAAATMSPSSSFSVDIHDSHLRAQFNELITLSVVICESLKSSFPSVLRPDQVFVQCSLEWIHASYRPQRTPTPSKMALLSCISASLVTRILPPLVTSAPSAFFKTTQL